MVPLGPSLPVDAGAKEAPIQPPVDFTELRDLVADFAEPFPDDTMQRAQEREQMYTIKQMLNIPGLGDVNVTIVLAPVKPLVPATVPAAPTPNHVTPNLELPGSNQSKLVPGMMANPAGLVAKRRSHRQATAQDVAAHFRKMPEGLVSAFTAHRDYYNADEKELHEALSNSPNHYQDSTNNAKPVPRTKAERQKSQASAKRWRLVFHEAIKLVNADKSLVTSVNLVPSPLTMLPSMFPNQEFDPWLTRNGTAVFHVKPVQSHTTTVVIPQPVATGAV